MITDPCVRSISPKTELELMKLAFKNAVHGFVYAMVCKVVILLDSVVLISRIGQSLPPTPFICIAVLCGACSTIAYFFVFPNMFLGALVKFGYGEMACKLCGTWFMKKFLMIYCPYRRLTEKVLRLIEDDLRDCESLLEDDHAIY